MCVIYLLIVVFDSCVHFCTLCLYCEFLYRPKLFNCLLYFVQDLKFFLLF